MIDVVVDVINRYGNLIDEKTKRYLAYEILEELNKAGSLQDKEAKEIKEMSNQIEKQKPKDTLSAIFEAQIEEEKLTNPMVDEAKDKRREIANKNVSKGVAKVAQAAKKVKSASVKKVQPKATPPQKSFTSK